MITRIIALFIVCLWSGVVFGKDVVVKGFFGLTVSVNVDDAFVHVAPPKDFYDIQYGGLIDETTLLAERMVRDSVMRIKQRYAFSDWLTLLFVVRLADGLEISGDGKTVVSLSILRSLGYDATLIKIHRHGLEKLALGLPCDGKVYSVSFLKIKERVFMMYDAQNNLPMSLENEQVHFFDMKTRSNIVREKIFVLSSVGLPMLPEEPKVTKTLEWKYGAETFFLDVEASQNMLDYYKHYPQLGISFYFSHPSSLFLEHVIVAPLRDIIRKRRLSEREAVNFLLAFCLALPYKEDTKTEFGERCNFPDETIFALYSDCEDRSVLLSKLIDRILQLSVVGFRYKDHISVGVQVKEWRDNDFRLRSADGQTYLHCDPSFINSKAGDVNEDLIRYGSPSIIRVNQIN